jgi:hypothetical protein
MPALNAKTPAPPFGAHDYQIDYAPAEAPREVSIRARAALPLRVGDRYTVGRQGLVYDLMVEDVSRAAGGRWTARCRVLNQPW